MEIYVKVPLITIYNFLVAIMILSYTLILPMSQLQTQQLMSDDITNQITHRIFNTH